MRRPLRSRPLLAVCLGGLVLLGCATLSVEQEEEIGKEASRDLRKELDFVHDEWVVGYVRDISTEGIFITCREALRPGQEINCRFYLPFRDGQRRVIEVRAEVRHKAKKYASGVGLRFIRLPSECLYLIQRYLTERRQLQPESEDEQGFFMMPTTAPGT